MKKWDWKIWTGIMLLILSVAVYLIHYAIFRDAHHIFIYMVGDIAFVFIEVLMVTLIIHRVLSEREKRIRMDKMNMVIGAFFSEVGTGLLAYLSSFDPGVGTICDQMVVRADWCQQDFDNLRRRLNAYDYKVELEGMDLADMREYLAIKRNFLLRILENPNLLEHETFTDLLQAVFHLTEELVGRESLVDIPKADREHIAVDIKRSYALLVREWLYYMQHLKSSYPYFFSYAMRTNPFDREASLIIRE